MKYEDSIMFMEDNYDELKEKFIENNRGLWEEFVENEFQEYSQQDIDWDLEYERQRDYEDELKEIQNEER